MPSLGRVFARHPNAPARVVGVAVGRDDAASAAEFQRDFEFPYPTGVDTNREVRADYRLTRVPTVVLVGPDGKVARAYVGGCDELAPGVEQALIALEKGDPPPAYEIEGGG